MAGSVSGAVARIQTLVGAVSGIRSAPATLIEAPASWPVALSYVANVQSVSQPSATVRKALVVIRTEIHTPRKDLPRDYAIMDDFALSVPMAIRADDSLGGNVDTIVDLTGALGPGKINDIITVAWSFSTTVKIDAL